MENQLAGARRFPLCKALALKIMEFSPEVVEELKSYVYLYIDPNTDEVFYIGKGKGNRCFEHLNDESESSKVKKIKELTLKGQKPSIELLRYGLSDNEAALLESSLIDFVGINNLSNKVRGLHSRSFGRVTVDDIAQKYNADEIEVVDNVLLVTINRNYYSKISSEELYEFTRGVWKLSERREKVDLVFSVYQGIVREVYKVCTWYQAGTLSYKHREKSSVAIKGRWEFEGVIADETLRKKYIGKSVRNYITKGSQNPVKYIKC